MSAIQQLLTDHIDIWTTAETEKKSGRGRASGNAGSVYGIKKLRELILELAVRGKLVPQDVDDEPASELLKRIQAEKAKLIAAGKIKKDKPLPPITEDEKPFELPKGWKWLRLGNTGKIFNGNSINENEKLEKYTNLAEGLPFIATKDVGYGRDELDYKNGVLIPFESESFKVAHKGAVLICSEGGSAGKKIGISNMDICFGNKLYANEVWTGIASRFIFHVYQSPCFFESFAGRMTGIIGGISINEFLKITIPIPPLAEQHRIVAKVDELMALCDQLESQHSNAAEAHEKLVVHLLGTLLIPSQPPLLQRGGGEAGGDSEWQHIAAHFDTLFTTDASIDALKQTLLQLAVMGKLVPQDPNDEPASELLKRIQAEKAKLIAEGKIKKDKPLPPITEDEKPFELPKGWGWARLGALVEKSGAGWSPSCEGHPRVGKEWGVLKVSAVSWGKFLPEENKALPKSLDARLDCVVEAGDFLVSRANTAELVARSVVVEDCPPNLMLSDKIVRLRLSLFCDNRLINIINSSSFARDYYSFMAGGTSSSMKNVTREQILNLIVALPPLAEQHRIVAKVDELMALCDQLKTRIMDASRLQQKLADVLVEQAVA